MPKDLTPYNSFELIDAPSEPATNGLPAVPLSQPPFGGFEEEEGGAHLQRYMGAVLRFKWAILALTILGTASGFLAARQVKPQYTAQAVLWIETGRAQGGQQVGPIRPDELLESSSWIELLKTGLVLDYVVREERLFVNAANAADSTLLANLEFDDRFAPGSYILRPDFASRSFTLEAGSGAVVQRGEYGDSVGGDLGLRWQPDFERFPRDRAVAFNLSSPREVTLALREQLRAVLDRNGNFMQLMLEGTDPERITSTLNQITDRYVEVASDLKRDRLDELVGILDEQLAYAQERVRETETTLEDFRVETVTLPTERSTPVVPGLQITRDPVFDHFFDMRLELETIRQNQEMIRRVVGSSDPTAYEALGSVEAVRESPEMLSVLEELTQKRAELRALKYRYTDQHTLVQQQAAAIRTLEMETVPAIARQILSELATREQQLEARLESASQQLEQIPPRAIEEARLARAAESADNLYTNLLRRYEEARLGAASSIPDVRVLDEAIVPHQPSKDDAPMIILMAFAGSLGLGVLGAILRDRLDRRLRHPDQVTELGLAILAAVPNLSARRGGRDNARHAQEAFRSLRLSTLHAYGSAGPVVITVTSPGPGDGKSLVTGNLGHAFADIGRRTLVVDGDTRRGRLHDMFGLQRKPGLTDLLQNGAPTAQPFIQKTEQENLFLLSSGRRLNEGPELLSSRRMRDLVMELRSAFDIILVDSPPLGAGADAFALGTLTGSMLLVLRTGETDRELADAKLELLDRLPIRLIGAVLNGVPPTKEYRYYAYTSGYEARAEDPQEAALLTE